MSVFDIAAKGTLSEDTMRWFLRQAGHLMYTLYWFSSPFADYCTDLDLCAILNCRWNCVHFNHASKLWWSKL